MAIVDVWDMVTQLTQCQDLPGNALNRMDLINA